MKIIISTHIFADGPAQSLKKYLLKKKFEKLLWIGHPLFYNQRLKSSGYEIFKDGIQITEHYKKIKKIPVIISYLKDIFLNIYYVLIKQDKYDIYIGYNNLNAFSGLILKKLGKVKKVIYYVVDYTPIRFKNNILNYIYHKIECFCAKYCNETWNLSSRMIEAREKYKGLKIIDCGVQKIIPMGIWFNEIKRYNFDEIKKKQVVFLGHILEKQGIQYILDAIPLIIKYILNFKFVIIGDGEYINHLKKKAKSLNIENYIQFKGYIEDNNKINEIIGKSALAVALYEKGNLDTNFTYYADPGKIKAYLGAGVPILLSDVPHNASEIEKNKCGKIIDTDPDNISKAICDLLENKEVLRQYRENSIQYAKQFDWNNIFNSLKIFNF